MCVVCVCRTPMFFSCVCSFCESNHLVCLDGHMAPHAKPAQSRNAAPVRSSGVYHRGQVLPRGEVQGQRLHGILEDSPGRGHLGGGQQCSSVSRGVHCIISHFSANCFCLISQFASKHILDEQVYFTFVFFYFGEFWAFFASFWFFLLIVFPPLDNFLPSAGKHFWFRKFVLFLISLAPDQCFFCRLLVIFWFFGQ